MLISREQNEKHKCDSGKIKDTSGHGFKVGDNWQNCSKKLFSRVQNQFEKIIARWASPKSLANEEISLLPTSSHTWLELAWAQTFGGPLSKLAYIFLSFLASSGWNFLLGATRLVHLTSYIFLVGPTTAEAKKPSRAYKENFLAIKKLTRFFKLSSRRFS